MLKFDKQLILLLTPWGNYTHDISTRETAHEAKYHVKNIISHKSGKDDNLLLDGQIDY
jgi:hypothetical protein